MKLIVLPILSAILLLAADHRGLRPRGAAKDYPAHESADGITIAAAVAPAGKVQRQLSPDLIKAEYTVLEIAVYPDPGKDVVVSSDDFSMTFGSSADATRPETSAEVAASIENIKPMDQPRIPSRVQIHGDETIGASTGGYDPATGRRYPGGVYTATSVGVGSADPRVGAPPPTDPRYPQADPQYPDPPMQSSPRSVLDKLQDKALPGGRTTKPVAGYLYFPKVSPRLANSTEPYHLTYTGPTGEIHLTVPAK